MRYLALACDYDGTLACDGRVSDVALTALQRFRASGRKVILVTGRPTRCRQQYPRLSDAGPVSSKRHAIEFAEERSSSWEAVPVF